ncbi:phosphotransferase [Pseudonocardia humida]|uniref:Aminoglycoside phosphotransferase family protein n=1 Tax=Pseudonocardia humida TaxID=2800819 RepID=A0ABT1ABB0_9PSEU|nr:phosphotransferase [Pseudonocardia humida]MCO1660251.1 aminoglycoside phosphotransferase family protein [Pseudonocardia humida]
MSAPAPPADGAWLPAVRRWAGGPVVVRGRHRLAGGFVADAVQRVDLESAGRVLAVVVKAAGPVEVAAMRALDEVRGVARPRLLAAGPDWIVTPFYPGSPPADDEPVDDEVFATLARVHAHWAGRLPPGVPVVDAAWWAGLCDHIVIAVRSGSARTGDARFVDTARALQRWRDDRRVAAALEALPRTLVHGDPHRGNLLAGPDGTVIIDWGNARAAPAGLDLAVLDAQGAATPAAYTATRSAPGPLESAWATLQVHVQYMGFAAEHLGPARVAEMAATASAALVRLGW